MDIRIVKEEKKVNNKNYVYFMHGNKIENRNKNLKYLKNDVVFIEKHKEIVQIKEYHVNESLMKYLYDNKANRGDINKSILINKFTNIFNLNKSYEANSQEKNILKALKENNEIIKESLNKVFDWINFSGKVNDKLVVGLGNQSVFETSITLHHTYGVPYIPGSAIKGILRNYIIQEYFDSVEDKANDNKYFLEIFGGKDKSGKISCGKVIFMDAFPLGSYKIKSDIMTPHHEKYFSASNNTNNDKKISPPKDSDEPQPISFLVLNNENVFKFNVAVERSIEDNVIDTIKVPRDTTIVRFLLENLIDALNYHGIGAKTSVGYGYFDIDKESEITKLINKELKRKKDNELKRKKELEELEKLKTEEEFNKATLGMSELQKELYKIKQIKDKNKIHEQIMNIYNKKLDDLNDSDKRIFAKFYMNYLKGNNEWKCKKNKKKEIKKFQRVKKICDILEIDLPM